MTMTCSCSEQLVKGLSLRHLSGNTVTLEMSPVLFPGACLFSSTDTSSSPVEVVQDVSGLFVFTAVAIVQCYGFGQMK